MKNLTKRIISTMLCAAVTAVNVGIGEVIPSVSVTADAAGTQSIFDDRANTVLGSSAEDIAIKKADPYGTADNNGNGKKWAALTVVPEVFSTNEGRSNVVDYTGGMTAISDNNIDVVGRLHTTAGINVGNGRKDMVAHLYYESDSSGKNLNLVVTGADKLYLTSATTLSTSVDYLDNPNHNVRGQYLAVATGDFDGDGVDSIIAYIPDISSPVIKEYAVEKKTAGKLEYYACAEKRTVGSDVYADFNLAKFSVPSSDEDKSRNVPIVDIVAADVDRDGCDELIVTAGLGHTTTGNNCNTVMKIYDLVNGTFKESYTKSLSGTYNGQQGRIRWASSAVGNVVTGSNLGLGVDFPEIVTAGWVDVKNAAGISMKKRFGVHITELSGLTEKNGTYVGTYQERTVLGTSESTISSAGSDGVSAHMKDGFTADWTRHEKLAVSTLAYKGPAAESALMLGDTVYDVDLSSNKLSAAYWSKDITDHTRYNVRKTLTGYYNMAPQAAMTGGSQTTVTGIPVNESVYFLCADVNNTYAAYAYYYNNGTWTTTRTGTNVITEKPANTNTVDICNVDVDNDGAYIKLNKVTKVWTDPKPLYVLEAAPYFSEFPDSKGTTTIGHAKESGSEFSWNAGVYASVEMYAKQGISVVAKLVELQGGMNVSGSLTYQGSTMTSLTVDISHSNFSYENQVIVERTPLYFYSYDVMGCQDSEAFNVSVAGKPSTTALSVEEYNQLALAYNNKLGSDEQDKKVTLIDEKFGLGTPGDPLTYRRSFPQNELVSSGNGNENLTDYNGSQGSTQKTITKTISTSNGYDIQLSTDRYAGMEVLGMGIKYTFGIAAGTSGTFFDADSISCTGEIPRQNVDSRYNFQWDVARWITEGIPVVGYMVSFEKGNTNYLNNLPPVAPAGLDYTTQNLDDHSVILTWDNPPTASGRVTPGYFNIYCKKSSDKDFPSTPTAHVKYSNANGSQTYTLTGLERGISYQCYVTNVYQGNAGAESESYANKDTAAISFTTNDDKELVTVTVKTGKGLTLKSGSSTQSVDKNREAITPVIYNVLDGYQIPSGFYRSSNGIEAQSAGNDIVKVFGTPTANTTINIGDMSLINYSISYHLNNGTLSNPVNSYTIESDTITIPKPVRAGYVFDGWTDAYGNSVTEIKKGSTGNITLTANWKSLGALGYTDNYPADGSEEYPYIISSKSGWDFFCDCLEDTANFNGFSGKYIQLKNNITVSKMAGSETYTFNGTFDGQGNTLTFNYGSTSEYKNENNMAPFSYTKDCTIKNLHVAGDIYTAHVHVGGMIGLCYGTTNLTNCRSSINIHTNVGSSNNYDGTHGGLISCTWTNSTTNIKGCIFDGSIVSTNTKNPDNQCGGFVGWRNGTINVTDSIVAPAAILLSDDSTMAYPSQNFVRNGASSVTNCYYTTPIRTGSTQGKAAHTVTAGNNVTIDYGKPTTAYSVSGITAYAAGLAYNGNFYAGKDNKITLTLGNTIPQGSTFKEYTVNAGMLTAKDNAYVLTMPDENVTINADYDLNLLENLSDISSNETALGGSITIKAAAKGGTGSYTYAVYCKKTSDTKWVTKQSFAANDTVTFKPAYASDYDICVKVKDGTGLIEKKYFVLKVNEKVTNLSALVSDNINLGEQVTVNCLAENGLGEYQYQVFYKQTTQSKWTVAQDFSTNATVKFTPKNAKTYDVCVKVKDDTGKLDKLYFTVTVNDNRLKSTATISAETIKAGESVTLNCSAKGGTAPYTYSVQYKQQEKSKWATQQNFAENAVIKVTPASVTAYDICVKVQDQDGTVAKQYFVVTVTK